MVEIALMLEGQNGLTWDRWMAMADAAERLGFVGLYRSDHFTNASPPDVESLELWTSLTWLASHSTKLEFGPLVTPASFRHPAMTARMAAAVDDLSGGRLHLGVGAGWQEREHTLFGFDLLDVPGRMDRFEESLEVVTRLLESDEPVTFEGRYYQLRGATLLPRPKRRGGPPIVIGGNGERRTLPLVARYAHEWNGVIVTPERFAELNTKLDRLVEQAGREPASIRRTLMTGLRTGRTEADVRRALAGKPAEEVKARGFLVGTYRQVAEQVEAYGRAGVQRLMLQWLELDDLVGLQGLAEVLISTR